MAHRVRVPCLQTCDEACSDQFFILDDGLSQFHCQASFVGGLQLLRGLRFWIAGGGAGRLRAKGPWGQVSFFLIHEIMRKVRHTNGSRTGVPGHRNTNPLQLRVDDVVAVLPAAHPIVDDGDVHVLVRRPPSEAQVLGQFVIRRLLPPPVEQPLPAEGDALQRPVAVRPHVRRQPTGPQVHGVQLRGAHQPIGDLQRRHWRGLIQPVDRRLHGGPPFRRERRHGVSGQPVAFSREVWPHLPQLPSVRRGVGPDFVHRLHNLQRHLLGQRERKTLLQLRPKSDHLVTFNLTVTVRVNDL
mmetsp:Transcript_49153/g.80822  ORF Transcript_49153/g.80822 Transcript_49153/m.80822 type:complete len:298 (-) Transcript_49153:987-1880(-)